MLTDVALKNFKPKAKPHKVTDRDGTYPHVSPKWDAVCTTAVSLGQAR